MVIGITGPITEITVGPETGMVTEMIIIKGMATETKITVDLGTEMEEIGAAPGRVSSPGIVPKTDIRVKDRVETTTEIGTGLTLDLDPLLMYVLTGTEAGVTGVMSMIILPENVLMILQVETPIMPKTHS